MYSNALTYLLLFAFALSISAILVVSLILKLRGQLSERGKVVARATLAVAILSIAIAQVKLGLVG
ncbi:hypothetical protein [Paracoccus sp. DMF]|uniref:hypothetical protein n=1 Tax=Paracoccus sp. DMF TaxID=400837 RepID=UPI001103613C|nr:hypothetical protein [Paracoccus sp. DMF]MCV2448424.1 hypothetical protein [Paracoccus sp. DMF]